MKPYKPTKKGLEVIEILKNTARSLTAAEIHTRLPHIDLSTIYRNLDRLIEHKFIKRILLDGHEAQFEYQREPHHHAICTDCEKVIHFPAPDQKILDLLKIKDFDVSELEITVRGHCHR